MPLSQDERRKRNAEAQRRWAERNPEKAREYSARWQKQNPELAAASRDKWKAANLERHRESHRKHARKKLGIVGATGETKNGLCEICARVGPLDMDHCHETGMPRGWLCRRCNMGIGQLGESPAVLQKAIEYLQARSPMRLVG